MILTFEDSVTEHLTEPGHPETPERIRSVMHHLNSQEWFRRVSVHGASTEPLSAILQVHENSYLEHVKKSCEDGSTFLDSRDVSICPQSFNAALISVSLSLTAADLMISSGDLRGFSMNRPPGHHAERSEAMGFCIFNNIAITAKYLQNQHGIHKIAILDWDVHHGNGTQHLFYEDPSVLYLSIHQFPFYPGTGRKDETGSGKGRGFTKNYPLPAGCGNLHYQDIFENDLLDHLSDFNPEAILISAGFDAHAKDPLGSMDLTSEMFGWMTEKLTATFAKVPLLSLLEGGYNLNALAESVSCHLSALMEHQD